MSFAVIRCQVDWLQLKVSKRVLNSRCASECQSNSNPGLVAKALKLDFFFACCLKLCALLGLAGFVTMSVCRFDLSGVHLKATGFQDPNDENDMSQESSL